HGDYDTQTHGLGFAHYLWSDDHVATPDIYTYRTPAGTDFLPVSAPASQRVCSPTSAQYTIDLLQFQAFSEQVTLSTSGAPPGAITSFSVNPVTPPGSSLLTVNTTAVPASSTSFQVIGTSSPSAIVHSTQVQLTVDVGVPTAPTLVAPADGAVELPLKPVLSWSPILATTGYGLEVATDPGFTNVVISETALGDTTYQPASNLVPDTTYYWRTTADNSCGTSSASAVRNFTTGIPRVLLVDDDNNDPDVLPTYLALLTTMSINNEVWDTASGEPTLGDLTNYEAVVWFSGDKFCSATSPCAGPQTAAETALGQFLEAGGCAFISSQDYLWDMGGSGHNTATPFMANYLGLASAISDNGDYTSVDGRNVY
ncbi:MAG: hypothetical protein KDB94_08195, partial [Acidobacteria bacterium]|nr:hypothetical protein [Acidobacteriota bacterium]